MATRPFHRRRTIPPPPDRDGLGGLKRVLKLYGGRSRLPPSVIPSEVEESLTILYQEMIRDVSVRAGLAYSLDMTKAKSVFLSWSRRRQFLAPPNVEFTRSKNWDVFYYDGALWDPKIWDATFIQCSAQFIHLDWIGC
jgi:hypothetical protein